MRSFKHSRSFGKVPPQKSTAQDQGPYWNVTVLSRCPQGKRGPPRSATKDAENQVGMDRLFIQHLSRHGPRFILDPFLCRNHAAGTFAPAATLTCHFFELLTLDIGALAIGMIELCRQACS